MLAIRCEHTMEASKLHPQFGHQGGWFDDEVKGFEDHMGGAVALVCFQ